MPTLPLTLREAFNAESTDEIPVVLVQVVTADAQSFYLCSEPATRLSADPLRYGLVHQGQDYGFVMMSASWPDDQESSVPATTLSFANVVEDMAAAARSVTPGTQADVVMSLVLSSDPDTVEERYLMKATGSTYTALQVSLSVSREPIEMEAWPAQRMTKQRLPGLFR